MNTPETAAQRVERLTQKWVPEILIWAKGDKHNIVAQCVLSALTEQMEGDAKEKAELERRLADMTEDREKYLNLYHEAES